MTQHLVQFSGGVGSWAAAKRVAAQHGTENLTLVFADTLMEDPDLYRFLEEAAANVGGRLIRIAEGRTPWEVFADKRFLGNSRVDPCSRILKREFLDAWRAERFDPADTIVYLGIDWTEEHRYLRAIPRFLPWKLAAPLCEPPFISKAQMLADLEANGIKPPRLYELGFPHNNCGGFCVKAGHSQFKLLLQTMPDRYAEHEAQEERLRAVLGDVSILTDRRGDNKKKPLTLKTFRQRVEQGEAVDRFDWGGCGCAIDDSADLGPP